MIRTKDHHSNQVEMEGSQRIFEMETMSKQKASCAASLEFVSGVIFIKKLCSA